MSAYSIQNILVPVDLSESSLNALDSAIAIAKANNAALHLLYIEERIISFLPETSNAFSSTSIDPADILNAHSESIQHNHFLKPNLIKEKGNVPETILNVSSLYQIDLIVMGTHGASGYREGFIGNNTYNTIKYAPTPVLAIPNRRKISLFKKILYPIRPLPGAQMLYDYVLPFTSFHTNIELLGITSRIMEKTNKVLNAFVETFQQEMKKDLVDIIVRQRESNTIGKDLVTYAAQTDPDLIVLTAALEGSGKQEFVGPHTQMIINCAKAPILSLKNIFTPAFT